MKNIAVLGSTGSIGQNTLAVIRSLPGQFRAVALSVQSDTVLLKKQIREFKPRMVCVADPQRALKLKKEFGGLVKVFCGQAGLGQMVKDRQIDQVMVAITGAAALPPLISAITAGKEIALANKEALVISGQLLMGLARKHHVLIRPVDSEQSAIWQGLGGYCAKHVRCVYLTASGGPLWKLPAKSFKRVSRERILKHPRWKMGKKITVDSATLMNKGLELLEAMFLFDLSFRQIKVLIHPEALVHSMVEFNDGITLAQISATDMRVPIQYALSYPQRFTGPVRGIDFYAWPQLHFAKPDLDKFPCLGLAYQAAKSLGTLPAVLNAANEIAVEGFLQGKVSFIKIPSIVEKLMRRHCIISNPGFSQVMAADNWARLEAKCLTGVV